MPLTWRDVIEPLPQSEIVSSSMIAVSLGTKTVNTCNPAVADINGDDLDEIAVPVTEGEADRITLFNSRGEPLWSNDRVRLFHSFYSNRESYRGTHWHYREPHRHLLTEIADIDGDGQLEVLCGDGPITILEGSTGRIKTVLDLNAHIQLWCSGRFFGADSPPGIIACAESQSEGSFVAAIGAAGDVVWKVPLQGRNFFDFIRSGDLDGDRVDEVAFCLDTAETFSVMDGRGRIRWTKNVRRDIADDSHVDDFVFDAVSPGAATQILTSTGPCLMNADGTVVWNLRREYAHGQKVIAAALLPDEQGKNVYLAEKYAGRAHLLRSNGDRLWTYDGFSRVRGGIKAVRAFLTSSGGLLDWPPTRSPVIAQVEILHRSPGSPQITGPATAYVTLLHPGGTVAGKIPIEDGGGPGWNGPMCFIPARTNSDSKSGFYAITHQSSTLLIG